MDPAQTMASEMAVDELSAATPQATSRAPAPAPLGTATTATANSPGLQASTHNHGNNTSATSANAKAKAINAAHKLADLASKADSKAVVDALSELVTQLAYWVSLENTASLITKVVKESL